MLHLWMNFYRPFVWKNVLSVKKSKNVYSQVTVLRLIYIWVFCNLIDI